MLGSQIFADASAVSGMSVFGFDRADFDISDKVALKKTFDEVSPDVVINCAAYTNVDDCEKNRDLAFKINADVVADIAKLCADCGATLIHFSTDYVFDGEKGSGYSENDIPCPINVYGESKLKGEEAILAVLKRFYIIRTSWLFGKNGKNFVDTIIGLVKSLPKISVVGDQIGSPTYTKDLSAVIISHFLNLSLPFGIYHVTNSGVTSWFNFAKKIFEIAKIDAIIDEVTSEKFLRPAKRPKNSVLLSTKFDFKMRGFEETLADYLMSP